MGMMRFFFYLIEARDRGMMCEKGEGVREGTNS